MNKEQQPQTEAEAMKAAAESWDTPVEKNEAAVETIVPNTETMEDDPMDMEIQNESGELEKNSEAVEKALADVGGVEGLQATIQEMPEDKKTAMIKKVQEEYGEKELKRRMNIRDWEKSKGIADSLLRHPFETMAEGDGQLPVLGTIATFMGGTLVSSLVAGGFARGNLFYQNFQRNRERRNHEKELKKLENSEV